MPIDPTGTAPGLPEQATTEPKHVNMKCRNPNCDSITAIEVKLPDGGGRRLYRCTKCHMTRGIDVGGSVNF